MDRQFQIHMLGLPLDFMGPVAMKSCSKELQPRDISDQTLNALTTTPEASGAAGPE